MLWESRGYVAAAAVLMGLALAAAGCGSGTTAEEPPRLTKAQFLKRGNAICAQIARKMNEVSNRYADKAHSAAFKDRVAEKAIIPGKKEEIRRLTALGPPVGGARRLKRIIAAIEEGIKTGEKNPRALWTLPGGDIEYSFEKALELESYYGLVKCGLG
jgi:hypothetical protein